MKTDSATISIDVAGSGPPLALIHGLGTNRAIWRMVIPSLADRHRVLAPDLPGFGESAPAGDGFELEAAADAVGDALASSSAEPVDLVGHSLGGAVALTLASRRPDAVRRLVLCAPAGFRPRSPRIAGALAAAVPPLLAARRAVAPRLVASPAGRRALMLGALHDGGAVSETQSLAMIEASRGARRLREAAQTAISADLIELLAGLDLPVGLLRGDRDTVMPAAVVDAIIRRRPGMPVEAVPAAGHVAQVERPAGFADALERLLVRLDV